MAQAQFDPEQVYIASCMTLVGDGPDDLENRSEANPGELVVMRARIGNDNFVEAEATVQFYLNGEVEQEHYVAVPPEGEDTAIRNFYPEDIGVTEGEVDVHITLKDIAER